MNTRLQPDSSVNDDVTIEDIALVLYPENASDETMRYAARFAGKFGARLSAVYIKPYPNLATGYYDSLFTSYLDLIQQASDDVAAARRARLLEIADGEGVNVNWFEATGGVQKIATEHIGPADFVITGHAPGEDGSWQRLVTNGLLLNSGRPIILVPTQGWSGCIAQTMTVAWDGSRNAARAVHDSMSLLQQARSPVHVVSVPQRDSLTGWGDATKMVAALGSHLARHNVDVHPFVPRQPVVDRAAAIKTLANAYESDLLIVGAWGQSRAREFVFGGVTRSVISECGIPVLLSH